MPLLLAACSPTPTLSLDDKAKFLSELLIDEPQCKVYQQQLTPPIVNLQKIDQTYLAAKQAHCFKPDV